MNSFEELTENDYEKFEKARRLKNRINYIRAAYQADWESDDIQKQQRGVALYFIDKLAFRAGNESYFGIEADTVGCCSLRCEHIKLFTISECDDIIYVVNFDFVGKSSVPYHNTVEVEEMVFTNLEEFISNKQPKERVFDRLNPAYLNRYLGELMPGLTIKVFRTYRASTTMQEQLAALTRGFHDDKQKKASYKKASDEVAKLLNHKRRNGGQREKMWRFLLQETTEDVASVIEQMQGLRIRSTREMEPHTYNSKMYYIDPRITVAWCEKFGVLLEDVFTPAMREKFRWATDMPDEKFIF
ncbi:hypothetical protein Aduo_000958 [Ancylostoma duodenale]